MKVYFRLAIFTAVLGILFFNCSKVAFQQKQEVQQSSEAPAGDLSVPENVPEKTSCTFSVVFKPNTIAARATSLEVKFQKLAAKTVALSGIGISNVDPVVGVCRTFSGSGTVAADPANLCASGVPVNIDVSEATKTYSWSRNGTSGY